jgi:cytochrome c peroxidase
MKPKSLVISSLFLASIICIISCNKFTSSSLVNEKLMLPAQPYDYTAANKFVNNDKATLGRVLFYDKQLSLNNSISCGSCHKQEFGFADNAAFSNGVENKKALRNTPAIQNLSLHGINNMVLNSTGVVDTFGNFIPMSVNFQPLFWDARESDLQSLMLQPITNHIEMGIASIEELVIKLNKIPYYQSLVYKAYGQNNLTKENLSDALGHFNSSIRTINTKFDDILTNGLTIDALEPIEKIGFNLFNSTQYNCSGCHASVISGKTVAEGGSAYGSSSSSAQSIDMNSFSANIGLESAPTDLGFGGLSGNNDLNGRFRTPDLHNVALTAPYMHDGRFTTLDQVLGHYSHDIVGSKNLDSRLRNANGTAKQLNISDFDKKAIIAFLQTLTCQEVTKDIKYSNPFVASK